MGLGRSGSTILGVVLGNLKDYFFGGEIHLWLESKGVPTEREDAIAFWAQIAAHIPEKEEYFNAGFNEQLEFHTAVTSVFRSKNRPIVNHYHTYCEKLFSSIEAETHKNITVDSSHYPMRAYWLNKNPNLDVYYIYLYRNAVDVLNAFRKKDVEQESKSFIGASIFMFCISMLSSIIYSFLPRNKKMKLRYEDLITNPQAIVSNIQKKLNTPQEALDFDNLTPGYIFRANRIRLLKKIKLETQLKKPKGNFFVKAFTYALQSPFTLLNSRKYK